MENINDVAENSMTNRYKDIPGWGYDADPKNMPTYPMKNYTGDDHERLNYERPVQQQVSVEILKSIERPSLSAVVGVASPPKGLSGMIRRFAFKYSESTYSHWVPLILADRVNMIEGIVEDLTHGHIPNIFMERGWNAEWKFNKKSFITNVVIGIAITSAVVYLVKSRRNARRNSVTEDLSY